MKNKQCKDIDEAVRVQPGDQLRIAVRDVNERGQGVGAVVSASDSEGGTTDRRVVFADGLIPGDEAFVRVRDVRTNYVVADVAELIQPSPDRAEPFCDLAGRCGGCLLQHMDYAAQLRLKERKVADALERIGGFAAETVRGVLRPIAGMSVPRAYRNKVQFPVGRGADDKPQIGFFAPSSHEIIDGTWCGIGHEAADIVRAVVRRFMTEYGLSAYDEGTGRGLLRHILVRIAFQTKQVMVVPVLNIHPPKESVITLENCGLPQADELIDCLRKALADCGCELTSFFINYNAKQTNRILGSVFRLLYGSERITEELEGLRFRISPESFFQVNPEQTEVLYRSVLEAAALRPEDTVFDLYCGTGSISLLLAGHCRRVIGNEIVEQAVHDAEANAALNGIDNAEFHAGPAEVVVPQLSAAGTRADVVVFDPPRKGCDARLLSTVLEMSPERIVYVSCNPATLARDLKILCAGGTYRLERVRPVDMFPQTMHVECVVLITRKND